MIKSKTKGFFGVGVEGSSKAGNAGNLLRTTHAFGGSFFFFIAPILSLRELRSVDTSGAANNMPVYHVTSAAELQLPRGCQLIGVELTEEAIPLPSFRHPRQAAYVLGPERGSLSPQTQARCDHIVHIPMQFCVNVGVAGAITLYDRMISLGRFAERPVRTSQKPEAPPAHVHGGPVIRSERRARHRAAHAPTSPSSPDQAGQEPD